MKTPKEWVQIHGENAFYANGVLSESDIESIQLDALQDQMEKYNDLTAAYEKLQRRFDDLRESF